MRPSDTAKSKTANGATAAERSRRDNQAKAATEAAPHMNGKSLSTYSDKPSVWAMQYSPNRNPGGAPCAKSSGVIKPPSEREARFSASQASSIQRDLFARYWANRRRTPTATTANRTCRDRRARSVNVLTQRSHGPCRLRARV